MPFKALNLLQNVGEAFHGSHVGGCPVVGQRKELDLTSQSEQAFHQVVQLDSRQIFDAALVDFFNEQVDQVIDFFDTVLYHGRINAFDLSDDALTNVEDITNVADASSDVTHGHDGAMRTPHKERNNTGVDFFRTLLGDRVVLRQITKVLTRTLVRENFSNQLAVRQDSWCGEIVVVIEPRQNRVAVVKVVALKAFEGSHRQRSNDREVSACQLPHDLFLFHCQMGGLVEVKLGRKETGQAVASTCEETWQKADGSPGRVAGLEFSSDGFASHLHCRSDQSQLHVLAFKNKKGLLVKLIGLTKMEYESILSMVL